METQITIFDIPEKELSSSKSQRELEYENLKKISKLSSHHFGSFYEIELYEEQLQRPKTNIPSVLCKYMIQYCMPIITNSTEGFHIALQNETPTYAFNKDLEIYQVIPSNEQFKAVGLRLPILFMRHYNLHMLSQQDHYDNVTLANSGQFGQIDQQTLKYTMQRDGLTHAGLPKISNQVEVLTFKSNEDTVQQLTYLLNYIDFLESYYQNNLLTLYNDFKVDPYTPNFENDGKQVWNIRRESNNKLLNFDDTILNKLKDSLYGAFGVSYDFDIQLTLDRNNLLYAYNIGRIAGIDDPLFKKEQTIRKNMIEYDIDYNKQLNEGFSKKLEIAKKQTIALNKYNITDLSQLDSKQKSIVELEYKKLEKYVTKDLSDKAKSTQKLFYRLRGSFLDITSERLEKTLSEIRKLIPDKDLNKLELLEGGVCPHVFYYGAEMLKNFGKPWMNTELRDYIIGKFSLPKDRAGHFCKICGEQIAEADNEEVMRFANGERITFMQTDDPLQTMIWKEAMYIVTTYIKFNTPMPLKPLVGSLASGLRGIIGEEESKLYKSKTNTTDSIRDTLNLYASIYIYAALCALMINNPNKMMFGKDKPSEGSKGQTISDNSDKPIKLGKPGKSPYVETSKVVEKGPQGDKIQEVSEYVDNIPEEPTEMEEKNTLRSVGVEGKGISRKKHKYERRKMREITRDQKHYRYVTGGKVTKDIKLYERYILTTALNLILLTKDAIIKRLKNMNVDLVKQVFLKNAYTWAKTHAKPIKIEQDLTSYAPRVQTIISTDPFYNYLYYAKRLAYNSGADKHYPSSLDDIPSMLGRSADQIDADIKSNTSDTYDTVKLPSSWRFGDELFDSYTYDSFMSMLEYIKDKVYQKEFVPPSTQVTEYFDKYKHVLEKGELIRQNIAKKLLRPLFQIEWLNNIRDKYNDFRPEKIDLAQHYCPNGERHKVGSYMYSSGKSTVELTKKEIVSWLEKKDIKELAEFSTMHIVNERCEKCKNLIRDAKSSDRSDKLLSTMFRKLDDVSAFYQYFETRCPKGNLHDIQDNKCIKCGLHTDFKKKGNDEYYNKYLGLFKKVEMEKSRISINSLKQAQEELKSSVESFTKFTKLQQEYKTSMQKTAEWSQLSGVKYNILANLGLSEGYKFDDIEKARINPTKQLEEHQTTIEGMYKTQALKIKGYILQVLREYNMLLNYENIVDIPIELKEILDIQKKIDIRNLHSSMPKFLDNFLNLDNKYKYILNPDTYSNFLMEYLSGIMVSISKDSAEKYKTMAKMLIKYFTTNILTQEKLFSKAETIFLKLAEDVTKAESDSEDEQAVSGDEYGNNHTEPSGSESDEDAVEVYENVIDDNAMDVENPDDIWENE